MSNFQFHLSAAKMSSKTALIIAGEPSGDLLGAHLAKSLKTLDPTIRLAGMGGKHMRNADVEVFINAENLAIIGFLEILWNFNALCQAMHTLKRYLKKTPPDLIIFIDYPGFNLHMAKEAKKVGIKVLYYVSPQVWAWRYKRIKKIKKYVDHMAVLFDFEKLIYQRENIPVSFVGHPLANTEALTTPLSRMEICKQLNIDPNKPIVALFPGSRKQEINKLLPIMLQAAKLIQIKILSNVQFILPLALNLDPEKIRVFLPSEIKVIYDNVPQALTIAHAAVAASGTITLEIALQKVPLIIIYKVSPLTFWFAKKLVRVSFVGLCNLVAQECVAVELLQQAATPQAIANEVFELLNNNNYRQSIIKKLACIRSQLNRGNTAKNAAKIAYNLIFS